MKKALTIVLLGSFLTGLIALPQHPVLAACSYNGYVNSGGKCSKSFKEYKKFDRPVYYDYRDISLERYIEFLRDLIRQLENERDNDDSRIEVETLSANDIEDDGATLRGRLDLNTENDVRVYFSYGRTSQNLNRQTSIETLDDGDGEKQEFSAVIESLEEDTVYYFRAVAIDDDGERVRGKILRFTTDDTGNDADEPVVVTRSAENITDDSARVRGEVDMNDFENGQAFFVYGEDQDLVEEVDSEYDTYADIDEDSYRLQKVLVDPDVDGDESFEHTVLNLRDGENVYFAMCVEYEDEDDDEQIICGGVRTFKTDN